MNWPVSASKPTWVRCTGFSGSEMLTLRGEPSMLLRKVEKPLFFRSRESSEKRLDADDEPLLFDLGAFDLGAFVSAADHSPDDDMLPDCLRPTLFVCGGGEVCDSGGGAGRRSDIWRFGLGSSAELRLGSASFSSMDCIVA